MDAYVGMKLVGSYGPYHHCINHRRCYATAEISICPAAQAVMIDSEVEQQQCCSLETSKHFTSNCACVAALCGNMDARVLFGPMDVIEATELLDTIPAVKVPIGAPRHEP